jgi:hypothetical protein
MKKITTIKTLKKVTGDKIEIFFYQVDNVFCAAVDAGDESVILSGHRAPEHRALDQKLAGHARLVVALVVAWTRKVGRDRRSRTATRLKIKIKRIFELKKRVSTFDVFVALITTRQ